MAQTYEHYFNIDPKYYAAVTADLIRQGKVNWKDFYPHETFVKLLETTYRVLSGKASRSIWVEGAYGTGKSHAALTIKSLLDASDEDVREYFDDFGLSSDLREKYISLKHSGDILTVHRIESANIHSDTDLIMAVQESILAALKDHGVQNQGEASMRDAFLEWAKDEANKDYFQKKLENPKYLTDFSGMGAEDVIRKLETGTMEDVERLMGKVMGVLKDSGVYGLFRDTNQMAHWIESIIEKNHLSSILFVWDEFSEFFQNHSVALTGFQTLIEISESHPFYFLIVAHESRNLFQDTKTANKTLDRFEPPVKIELPENMAFKLMAQAMKVTDDPALREEWQSDKMDLNDMLGEVRQYIIRKSSSQNRLGKKTHLTEEELQAIVPLHPYAALVLKHIATVFNSNQRSMFDFIISNDMTDAKGFKWFIHTYGAQDEINLLTIDLLWDFFCGKQKLGLNDDVRGVLDSYNTLQLDKLNEDEKRVVKTILLFQAISLHIAGNELLAPNKENLDMAFGGTEWNKGKAINIATALVNKGFLFTKPVASGQEEYCVAVAGTGTDMGPYLGKAKDKAKASMLIAAGELKKAVAVPPAVNLRYTMNESGTGFDSFSRDVAKLKMKGGPYQFKTLVTFALNDVEQEKLNGQIHNLVEGMDDNWVVIQALTPMGQDLHTQYVKNLAFSFYHAQKNREQATHYEKQALAVLATWQHRVAEGAFMVYTAANKNGERKVNSEDLAQFLMDWDRKTYYYGVEQYPLNDTMYGSYNLGSGALCGIQQKLSGAYKSSNKNKSFESALKGAWQVPVYWKKVELQNLPIVHIKNKVEEIIAKGFGGQAGRVSIKTIWQALQEPPFGFLSCSACALVLGFVLKEYATSNYFWTNGSLTKPMDESIMKEMIAKVMQPGGKSSGKEEYIVTMTAEVRLFLQKTAEIFHIPSAECSSVESAKNQIRIRMRAFRFPLWTVKSILAQETLATSVSLVEKVIDGYCGIANDANYNKESSNTLAERIGQQFMEHPSLLDDMKTLCTSQKTEQGMAAYLETFQNGILLKLAAQIEDQGRYMERIKAGFSAGEANWVWNTETVDRIISDVIVEYQIVEESRTCLGAYHSYDEVIRAWRDKATRIRIPCEILRSQVGALGSFLDMLFHLAREGMLKDKAGFYTLLCQEGKNFIEFYNTQFSYFQKAIADFTTDLNEEKVRDLYLRLDGQFTRNATPFYQDIQARIQKLHQNEVRERLQKLWKEKTGTKDPKDWSRIHRTPILCLFDDEERNEAKRYLPLIGTAIGEEVTVKEAIQYLEQADFYEKLQDTTYIDRCFMERVVGEARILLKDASKIRSKLYDVDSEVYNWWNNEAVKKQLRNMRNQEYLVNGKNRAEQVFLQMSAEELRTYLKDKLADPDFGMQILKGQK